MIPPQDFDLICEWAANLAPERQAAGFHYSVTEHGSRYLTIREVATAVGKIAESRPVARLRYTSTTGRWELFYSDSNQRFHVFEMTTPTTDVERLLNAVAKDELGLFFPPMS